MMRSGIEFRRSSRWTYFALAALSAFVAISLLGGVALLFQRDGTPMERWVVAEKECAQYVYVSERDTCVRARLQGAGQTAIAKR
jgi:hypothetical protein